MKNIEIHIGSPLKLLSKAFTRFHMTFFIVFLTAGLGIAVLFLNDILTETSLGDDYTSPIDAGSIDQATLNRIKELHTSDDTPAQAPFPNGRINPFGE